MDVSDEVAVHVNRRPLVRHNVPNEPRAVVLQRRVGSIWVLGFARQWHLLAQGIHRVAGFGDHENT
jgi:hypothetical protein